MTVTIKDVAKLAKVSPSTVSRVIADNPRISHKTKERVKIVMDELGYHPNFNARSLINKSVQAIGLVLPNSTEKVFQNPFFPEVIRGISKVAHDKEYAILISTGETEDQIYNEVVRMVQGGRVDGLILLYSRVNDKVTNFLIDRKFPFTMVGKPHVNTDAITHVDNDNYNAGKSVTDFLLKLGHRQIGFVGGSLSLLVTVDRLRGYEDALAAADVPFNKEYIVHEEFLREGGQEAVKELMSLKKRPSALVVADDLMALGMFNTLAEMKIKVPDHLSIISFNNLLLSEISRPPLTTVDVNIYQLGFQAAKCLIEKIMNPQEPAKRIIVPFTIIERNSCTTK
ncbi:LacI family DNA-binding transcriptional regulator [Bacillus pinisoli]|uniref:LacI family DNA-binding transcriptional regulator n=1 Tax=Bacillus pinisoli TaxID=2901866 RepID=UPI001FF6C8E5|nr:LacI family DNA-binding transcriptional regulator [Bacillus pinisoli]